VSIARARVLPGVTTEWHRVKDIDERYVIVRGTGKVEVGDVPPAIISEGDVVRIPANTPQRITNVGDVDLVFFAVSAFELRRISSNVLSRDGCGSETAASRRGTESVRAKALSRRADAATDRRQEWPPVQEKGRPNDRPLCRKLRRFIRSPS
jgi:hypothetical protein